MVRMEIHPERSSGSVTNNIPNQQTAELTTNVMVPDGSTLVIGGLIEDEDDFSYQGLPLLSRFPALGFLTGARQKIEGRRELVVLLTPHIWSIEQAMAHAPAKGAITAAFDASSPGVSTSAPIDRQKVAFAVPAGTTARPTATGPPADGPTAPGQVTAGLAPPSIPPGRTDQAAMLATSATPGLAVGSSPAAPGADPADPTNAAPPPRSRWPSLRDWMARRSRDRDANRSASPDPRTQPTVPSPGEPGGPPADASGSPPDGTSDRPSQPPQQLLAPDNDRPLLEITRIPRLPSRCRGPNGFPAGTPLAQTSWQRDRIDAAGTRRRRDDRGAIDPAAAAGSPGTRNAGVAADPRRHSIAQGETMETIARTYHGSDLYADSLRHLNRDRIPNGALRAGDQIVIPPREELDAVGGWVVQAPSRADSWETRNAPADRTGRSGTRAAGPAARWTDSSGAPLQPAGPRSTRSGAAPARRSRPIVHVVGPHESPRSIARDRLGDSRRADEIIELNRDLLARQGRWTTGLRIVLPPDASPEPESP